MENVVLILCVLFMFAMSFVLIELLNPTNKKRKKRGKNRKKK